MPDANHRSARRPFIESYFVHKTRKVFAVCGRPNSPALECSGRSSEVASTAREWTVHRQWCPAEAGVKVFKQVLEIIFCLPR